MAWDSDWIIASKIGTNVEYVYTHCRVVVDLSGISDDDYDKLRGAGEYVIRNPNKDRSKARIKCANAAQARLAQKELKAAGIASRLELSTLTDREKELIDASQIRSKRDTAIPQMLKRAAKLEAEGLTPAAVVEVIRS